MHCNKLFLFILLLANTVSAQTDLVDIQWGEEELTSRSSTLSDIVGYDETGIYTLKLQSSNTLFFKNSQFTLEHYNKEIKKTKTVLIDLTLDNRKTLYEGIYQFGGRLYLFSSQNNRDERKNTLYLQLIDKKTLKPSRERAELANIGYKNKNNDGRFDVILSRDSSNMMITYDLPYKYGTPERFGVQVYNKRFSKLWSKEIELPYPDQLFQITSYRVDSKGNAYILGKVFKDRVKERRNGKPNYKYHIIAYLNEGEEVKEYQFSFEEKFITDMQFEIKEGGDIIAAGFYSDKGSTSIKGSFYLEVDGKTKILKNKDFKDFNKEELTDFLNERKAEKGQELFQYELRELILREDGGVFLIAEQYYIKVSSYTDPSGFMRSDYKYYYNDLGIVNIDPSGKIKWIKRISKKQITTNDGGFYSSYAFSRIGNKLYLIFNDHPKNLHNVSNDKVYNFQQGKNATVVIVQIDDEGNMIKEHLFDTKEVNIITRPKVSEQVGPGEMIIFGQWKKSNRLAKITFH